MQRSLLIGHASKEICLREMDLFSVQRRPQPGKKKGVEDPHDYPDYPMDDKYASRRRRESGRFLVLILGLSMIGIISLVYYWYGKYHIPKISWSSGGVLKIFSRRVPERIIHSPAIDWKVWQRGDEPGSGWSPEYLIRNSRPGVHLNMTQVSDDPVFLFFDAKSPFARDSRIMNWSPPVLNTISPTIEEFFRLVEENKHKKFLYWSSQLDHLGSTLMADVEPSDVFAHSEDSKSVNLFLSAPGVIAHTHYDTYHNIYTQIYGTKKFYLFPPTSWPMLSLYPRLHPSHRQSKLPADYFEKDFHAIQGEVGGYEFVLSPGDVLYIPPFWYHRVATENVSISVNIWSNSEEMDITEELYAKAVPFESYWTLEQRMQFVPHFLGHVIDGANYKSTHQHGVGRCPAYRPGCRFTQDLIGSRYNGVVDIEQSLKLAHTQRVINICRQMQYIPDGHMQERSKIFSWLMKKLPDGARETIMMDFVEEWSLWAVEYEVDSVWAFLDSCFGASPVDKASKRQGN